MVSSFFWRKILENRRYRVSKWGLLAYVVSPRGQRHAHARVNSGAARTRRLTQITWAVGFERATRENAQTKSGTSILKMLFFCGYVFLSGWREKFSAADVFFVWI